MLGPSDGPHPTKTQVWDDDPSVVGRNSSSLCSITARKTIPCSCTTRSSTFNGGPRCTTFWVASLPTLPKEAWRSEPRRAVQANMQEVMARGLWKCESPVLRYAQPGQVQALASLVLPAALFFVVVSESLPSTNACCSYRNRLQETGLPVLNKIAVGARCSAAPESSSCVSCPCLTLAHWRAPAFAFHHRHGSFFYGQKENRSTTLTFNEASVIVLGIEVSAACPSPFPPRHCTLSGKKVCSHCVWYRLRLIHVAHSPAMAARRLKSVFPCSMVAGSESKLSFTSYNVLSIPI